MFVASLVLISSAAFPGCRTDTAVQRSIRSAINGFVRSLEAGDINALVSVYSQDLKYLPEGAVTDDGIEGTRAAYLAMVRRYRPRLEVRTDEIVSCGGLAYDLGRVKLTLTPRSGGKTVVHERRFLEIWRLEPGGWKVFRAMSNAE